MHKNVRHVMCSVMQFGKLLSLWENIRQTEFKKIWSVCCDHIFLAKRHAYIIKKVKVSYCLNKHVVRVCL